MKKYFKKVLSLLVVFVMMCSLISVPNTSAFAEENDVVLRFLVMSDVHVGSMGDEQTQRFAKVMSTAYDYAESQSYDKLDAILVAGDMTNYGYESEMLAFKSALDANLREGTENFMITGNHEFFLMKDEELVIENWENIFEREINTHNVLNGYHFINLSLMGYYDSTYEESLEWFEAELEAAAKDDPTKPIFVQHHYPVTDTVYGSDLWGTSEMTSIMEKYPQIISFSGHSHYPMNDPRSIWQGDFTALGCGTLAYFELEPGMVYGSLPPNKENACQYYVVEVHADNSVTIKGYDVMTEQFFDFEYTIEEPANKDSFIYTDARANEADAPVFAEGAEVIVDSVGDNKVTLTIPQATDGECIHSYRFDFYIDGDKMSSASIWSEFYFLDMPETLTYEFKGLLEASDYTVKVTAIDSWGKESETPITAEFTTTGIAPDSLNPGDKYPTAEVFDIQASEGGFVDISANNNEVINEGVDVIYDETTGVYLGDFDGSSSLYVPLDSAEHTAITKEVSLEVGFMLDSFPSSYSDVIGCMQAGGYGFEINAATESLEFWIQINGTYQIVSAPIETGTYYDAVAAYDGRMIVLYLNGESVARTTCTGPITYPPVTGAHSFRIGADITADGGAEACFDGKITHARVYNFGVTTTQVENLYDALLNPGKEDEPASGTYCTGNTWWGGGSYMVGYAAESGTIKDLEENGEYGNFWPSSGFPWWTAVVLDLQEDGTYLVTEIIPADGSNDKGGIELKAGRIVVNYHSEIVNDMTFDGVANKEFFDSLQVGDVLTAVGMWGNDVDWSAIAKNQDQATFTKVGTIEPEDPVDPEDPADTHENVVHYEAVEPGCHYVGCVEYWYCPECEGVWTDEALTQVSNHKNVVVPALGGEVIHVEAVEPGCDNTGNIEYWYCEECEQVWQDEALTQLTNFKNVILPAGNHENLVHMDAVAPGCHYTGNREHWYCEDCETVWSNEELTQLTNHKNVILPELGGEVIHVAAVAPTATENGNIEYWYCEECEQVWQDKNLTQLTNFKNVILPAISEEPDEPSTKEGAVATFANGYDWTAQVNQIYIFASEDTTASIASLTGQVPDTYAWFHTVVLEANEDGTYEVVAVGFGGDTGAISESLGEGKVILMAHDSVVSYADSYAWLKALAVGDVVVIDAEWTDIAAKFAETVEVSIGFVEKETPEDPEQPCTHEGLVHMEAVDAGCHYEGNSEHWYCPVCETVWADADLTQLTNHKNVIIPELGGEVVHVEAKEPTATENGNTEYWYCEDCEQVWQDEARTQLTNFKNVILPATGELADKDDATTAPETRDSAPIVVYVVTLMVAAAAVVVALKKRFA